MNVNVNMGKKANKFKNMAVFADFLIKKPISELG